MYACIRSEKSAMGIAHTSRSPNFSEVGGKTVFCLVNPHGPFGGKLSRAARKLTIWCTTTTGQRSQGVAIVFDTLKLQYTLDTHCTPRSSSNDHLAIVCGLSVIYNNRHIDTVGKGDCCYSRLPCFIFRVVEGYKSVRTIPSSNFVHLSLGRRL